MPYRKLLQTPQPAGATSDWYSIDVGPIHFVQINSEQNIDTASKQYK